MKGLQFTNIKLSELSVDDIGSWPLSMKILTLSILSILLLVFGYWMDISSQSDKLKSNKNNYMELRQTFEIKQAQAAHLEVYKRQLKALKKTFRIAVQQLPNRSEIPHLLESVSEKGIASGLEFRLIKPLAEKNLGFYAELPIEISVIGNYHQLAEFVSHLSGLSRIITLNDFNIESQNNDLRAGLDSPLVMNIIAKTYRYISDDYLTDEKENSTDGSKRVVSSQGNPR